MSKNEISNQPQTLKGIISSEKMQEQFRAALPQHLSPERFGRVAITALSRTPKLLSCTQESVMKCLLDLSAIGLEPDGRRAHLIPYGNQCTLVLDYKGIVELMRRSGDVVKIHSDVVCDNDVFSHSKGEVTEHTYNLKESRGEMYAAYTEITFKDSSTQSAIMSKDEIDAIRSRSKSGKSGPWVTDYNEMAKKTTLRRVSKLVTLSPEIRDIVDADNEREFEMRNVTQRSQMRSDAIDPFRAISDAKADKEAEIVAETQQAMEESMEDFIGEEAFADE